MPTAEFDDQRRCYILCFGNGKCKDVSQTNSGGRLSRNRTRIVEAKLFSILQHRSQDGEVCRSVHHQAVYDPGMRVDIFGIASASLLSKHVNERKMFSGRHGRYSSKIETKLDLSHEQIHLDESKKDSASTSAASSMLRCFQPESPSYSIRHIMV